MEAFVAQRATFAALLHDTHWRERNGSVAHLPIRVDKKDLFGGLLSLNRWLDPPPYHTFKLAGRDCTRRWVR